MKNQKNILISIVTSLIFFYCLMIEGSALKLGKRETIRSLGLSFRTFDEFKSRPTSFPRIFTNSKTKEKYYKVVDIWCYKQYIGSWGNKNSTLNIYEMSLFPPDNSSGYVAEVDASKKYRTKSNSAYWNKNEKKQWLELFSGKKMEKKVRSIKDKYGTIVEIYSFKEKNGLLGLFVVSNKRKVKNNVVFIYTVNDVSSKKQAMKLIYSSIKSIRFTSIARKAKSVAKKKKAGSNPDIEISKEKVIRNIKNLKDWWGIESKDYFIITNYPKSSKSFIKELEAELISSQKVYSRFYKRTTPLKDVNVVRVFKERDDYATYVGKEKEWSMGLWISSKKELVISPMLHGKKEDVESAQIKILRHEAFHQYLHFALGQVQSSAWFNEGNAVFFEGIRRVGRKLKIEPSNYLQLLKNMIKRKLDINALLKMNYEEFYSDAKGKKKVSENYALAWGIIYFLYKEAPKIKKKTGRDYTKILRNYYNSLVKTKSPGDATKFAWEKVNMKKFTADFIKYYKKL